MIIFWWTIGGAALLFFLIYSISLYRRVDQGECKELTGEEIRLCAKIHGAGLGKPWICKRAIDSGECPCLPCSLLEKAKQDSLAILKKDRPESTDKSGAA
jgi:hypothetical protein